MVCVSYHVCQNSLGNILFFIKIIMLGTLNMRGKLMVDYLNYEYFVLCRRQTSSFS